MGLLSTVSTPVQLAALSPPAPPPLLPSPCPSEPVSPQEPPFEGSRRPSYLCPRSGRLLVPQPQSPFDPLLGSEPCDPVGGPRSQAAGAARLRCWGESSAPFVPSSLAPVAGGPSGVQALGKPPDAWAAGPGAASPQGPPAGTSSRRDSSRSPGEGQRELGLHAGPIFSASE